MLEVGVSTYLFRPHIENPVHSRDDDQRQKRRECQTKNDRPGQRIPESHTVTTEIYLRIQIGKQGQKIYVHTQRQRHETKDR